MQALRVLKGLDQSLRANQNQIATGLKVSNARDNAAVWAVSTAIRSDVNTLRVVNDGISRAQAELAVVGSSLETITELLDMARAKSALLERPDNIRARATFAADIQNLLDQTEQILGDTSFNGATLLDGNQRHLIIGANGERMTIGHDEAVTAESLGLDAISVKLDAVAPQVQGPASPGENPENNRATFGQDALSAGSGTTGAGGSDGINGAISATSGVYVNDGASDFVKMLVYGTRWGSAGSGGPALTYSLHNASSTYSGSYGGAEEASASDLPASYEGALREIMAYASGLTGITFTEVTETATTAGDFRFAQTTTGGTAFAYLPGDYAEAGDTWISSTLIGANPTATPGTYAYQTIIHELGHALGLKHPHEANIDGNFNYDGSEFDYLKYSVMTYKDFVGDDNSGYSSLLFPTTFMVGDIAALQAMYGAGAGYAGDTTYSWGASEDIFETLWDSGGVDTMDLSAKSASLTIDLTPGAYSDVGTVVANTQDATKTITETLGIAYGTYIENVIGGSGSDTIKGNDADNTFTGGTGADVMDGGAGFNTAVFSGNAGQYTIAAQGDGSVRITGQDGTDTLRNIQQLRFDDGTVDVSDLMPQISAAEAALDDDAGDYTISLARDLGDMIDVAQRRAIKAATAVANQAGRLDTVVQMNTVLMDELLKGIGILVDTDMTEASARNQALQVQQQLATQSLSIANGNARSFLQLFG